MEESYYHIEVLKSTFNQKILKNHRYSLRAFSNYLKIDPSSLSQILKGKRKFPIRHAEKTVETLCLNEPDAQKFLKSVLLAEREIKNSAKGKPMDWDIISEDKHFKIIANWEYYAVLNLIGLDNFDHKIASISDRLGIPTDLATQIITDLIENELLKEDAHGKWKRMRPHLFTINETPSDALKEAHSQELNKACESLYKDAPEIRGFYSATVMTNQVALKKAKKLSLEFLERIIKIFETGPKEEVYQLGIQLFPLTKEAKKEMRD